VPKKGELRIMNLYLVQHGEAEPKSGDAERMLTERGRDEVARVAAFTRRAGVRVHQIRHSGKRRAEQTAAILAEHLAPEGGVSTMPGLAPKDDVASIAELVDHETEPLMLVGHLPFMDRLAGLLVGGDPERSVVSFRRGGVVCLQRDPQTGAWAVGWAVTPELMPEEGGTMDDRFEYRVCLVQQSRVTFANGQWLGEAPQTDPDVQRAFQSCPEVWSYLNQAGAEDWKLVAVTTRTQEQGQIVDVLYLERRC
jgi:phosphohistidine phosphatase